MQHIIINGRLTKDPHQSEAKNGNTVAGLSVAVNSKRRGEDKVTYYDAMLFGKAADTAIEHLSKGDGVVLTGELDAGTFQTNAGDTRLKLNVEECRFSFPVGAGGGSPEPKQYDDDVDF